VIEFARLQPQKFAAIATAVVVVLLLVVILTGSSSSSSSTSKKPDRPPTAPVAAPTPAKPAPPTAQHWVEQAESEVARRRYGRAIAAYERALATDKALARDTKVRTAVAQIATGGDAVAAVIALDVLATRLEPPDQKTIVEQASAGKLPDVRRRAFAIAEREGFEGSIDRFASWTLDLKQPQAACEDRRETIMKLRDLGDPRVLDVLKKARTQFACVTKDVDAAIAHLTAP